MQFIIEKPACPSPDQVEDYICLIRDVWQRMEIREWFAMDPPQVIRERLQKKEASLYLALESSSRQIAGLFMVTYPGLSEENLGRDLDFPERDLCKTAHMDTVIILPQYRGGHLQKRLMQVAEADLKQAGYRYLLCTIHPDNRYSLDNALALGYRSKKSTLKYGGLPRNILFKEL